VAGVLSAGAAAWLGVGNHLRRLSSCRSTCVPTLHVEDFVPWDEPVSSAGEDRPIRRIADCCRGAAGKTR
jgi:hypothetical protein